MPSEPLRPMSIYEAIEVMKILAPAVNSIPSPRDDAVKVVRSIIQWLKKHEPAAGIRLVALGYHTSMDEALLLVNDKSGLGYLDAITKIFEANNLPDIINGAAILGISERGW